MYWNLVDDQGFNPDLYSGTGGNNTAIQLIIDGLKLQPCNPTFLDARDAILLADQNNNAGANECLIWEGFAKRGMGFSAQDGGSSSSLNVTEAFDVPPQCVIAGCGNGICESGEDCTTCPSDCVAGTTAAVCGNGICEVAEGEDCLSCAADCNGKQNGKPSRRFCCGDGDGQNPVGCGDQRCSSGGFSCTDIPQPPTDFCCGDNSCDPGEFCSNCALDCTLGAEVCTSGIDEDCDGLTDCDDPDCSTDTACEVQCADEGESCRKDVDCCSSRCSGGKPSTRVCLAP